MITAQYPRWPPYLIHLVLYQMDPESKTKTENIFNRAREKFIGEYSEESKSLDFRYRSLSGYFKRLSEGGSQAFLLATGANEESKQGLDSITSHDRYDGLIQDLKSILPQGIRAEVTLKISYALEEGAPKASKITDLLEERRSLISAGIVRGCVLAIVAPKGRTTISSREYLPSLLVVWVWRFPRSQHPPVKS